MGKKNAILKALIESVVCKIMVKTNVENIYMPDDTTTLAAKLSEMVIAINDRAKTSDVQTAVNEAISTLRAELMGEGVPEAYDTFSELAAYIEEHQEAADALTAAIGNKLDKSIYETFLTTLGSLAKKSTVSESDLDSALREKVNAASEGNHSHSNKALLDTYKQTETNLADAVSKKHSHSNKAILDTYKQTEANLADAVSKKHDHSNKAVLDDITADDITGWNEKGRIIVSETVPSDMTENDLLIQLI